MTGCSCASPGSFSTTRCRAPAPTWIASPLPVGPRRRSAA